MPAARGDGVVPRGLPVVVGMDVHPARGDQETIGVDGPGGRWVVELSDRRHHPVVHCDVRSPGRASGPIDYRSPTNNQIMHAETPLVATDQSSHG